MKGTPIILFQYCTVIRNLFCNAASDMALHTDMIKTR
jgi:hypothetical protein